MSHAPRPWLARKRGESRDDWIVRKMRSCFWCPHKPFRTGAEADEHELSCKHNPDVQKRQDKRQ